LNSIAIMAQDLFDPKLWEHGTSIVVVAVFLWLVIWFARQLAGKDGAIPKITTTLIELKDLGVNQQTLCTRHSNAMDIIAQWGDKVEGAANHSKEMHDTWAHVNTDEFRVIPALDAMMSACDTCERVSSHCEHGEEVAKEIRQLKGEIVNIKARVRNEK